MTEPVSLIPADQLPAGVTEGVSVGGIPVYRYGSRGWGFAPDYAATLWGHILDTVRPGEDEPLRSGCIPAANWSGFFARSQAQAYADATARLIRAARRATAPKRAKSRADREAAAARHVEATRAMYAAHDAKHAAKRAGAGQ